MRYETNCTEIGLNQVADLEAMIDTAQEISYDKLLEFVDYDHLMEVFPFYQGIEDILTIESDYAVSFYQSTFKGKNCVYVYHSAIEYIFTD